MHWKKWKNWNRVYCKPRHLPEVCSLPSELMFFLLQITLYYGQNYFQTNYLIISFRLILSAFPALPNPSLTLPANSILCTILQYGSIFNPVILVSPGDLVTHIYLLAPFTEATWVLVIWLQISGKNHYLMKILKSFWGFLMTVSGH